MRKLNVMLSRKESLVQLVKGDAGSGKASLFSNLPIAEFPRLKNLENESLSCPFWNIDPWKMIWDMIEIESHSVSPTSKSPVHESETGFRCLAH